MKRRAHTWWMPGPAVRGGRTLVEHPLRSARPAPQRLAEHVLVAPARRASPLRARRDRATDRPGGTWRPTLPVARSGDRAVVRLASAECAGAHVSVSRRVVQRVGRRIGGRRRRSSPRSPRPRRSRTTTRSTRSGARASTARPRRSSLPRPIVAMATTAERRGLLAGRVRRRRLLVQRAVLRRAGRLAARATRHRHDRDAERARLLDRHRRRLGVPVRRREVVRIAVERHR